MTKIITKFLLAGFLFLLSSGSEIFGQVVINEICPTNISTIQNSNGKFDDWIELHNAGPSTINLAGYGLSDDITKPYRFTFPSYNLLSGKKILVFTSDSTSEIIVNHWEMAVGAATSWKYVSGSASIDTNWRNPSFNQASWSTGTGGIGFADGDDGTSIPVTVSVMMRKTFDIPDTSQVLKAILTMDYDDGFVAYLNGVEIARANIGTPGVRPAWNELALSSHEAQVYQSLSPDSFFIQPSLFKSLLKPTNNVLAIETHNTPANSNDLTSNPNLFFGMASSGTTFSVIPSWFHVPLKEYFNAHFKLSRYGETVYLTDPSGVQVDQKTYTSMEIDNSLCRKPDGSSTWCFVSTPTPDATNNSSTCYVGYAFAPVFSKTDGYYGSSQTLTLSTSTPGGVIRYTTNGNTPSISSSQYSSPISITTTTTIRARVFASGYLPSPIVTNTYIINQNTHLSSFSITTDSLNLWDYNTGIYVLGPGASSTTPFKGANFWQDWEKPAAIEFFDKSKNLVVKFDADIKIYGNYSRAKPQKSFEIKLSDKYGTGSFTYSIYPDKPYVDEISNIVLRNSGTDWNVVHFRDAMMERILKNSYTGYLAAEPVIAYLNGSYWGVYQMNENHDHHWMKNNFGLGKSDIDYLKESGSSIQIQEGSDASFWSLYNYATSQSPTSQAYYDYVNNLLDLKNYTDYFAAETFYNNGDWIGDWTNNIQMWRPNTPGSKWRYFVYDLDFGLGYAGSVNDNRLAIARNPTAFSNSSEMFDALLNNPTYKRYFINRYADLLNTTFLPSNMDALMKSFRDTMSYDMTAHFAKWGSNNATWQSNITSMMNFANARPDIMRDFIKNEFALTSKVTLTLATSPAGAGRIEISTITPTTYPWSGVYFNGNPVTITAIPNPGFTFDHFRSNVAITSNNTNQSVTYNFTANDVITAYFTGSATPAKISVSELNYNADSAYNAGDWVELHNYGTSAINISGWKLSDGNDYHIFQFPTGTVIPANGYLVVTEDSEKFISQFPTITNRIGPIGFNFGNGGDQVRLFTNTNALYLSFFYQDLPPWPTLADGGGYTCELTNDLANPNDGASWFIGCIGGSPGRAYSPLLAIPVTISGNTTFCNGGSALLNATYVPGYTYQWKRNNINITNATDSTYSATQSGSYSVTVFYQGCSIQSQATTINVVSQQPPPTSISASRCGPGQLTLLASSSDSVFWYDSNIGGNLLWIGDTLVTPFLNNTTTYYARTGRNCSSNSIATQAQILADDAPPVSSDVIRCGPGIATLNATGSGIIHWYNASSGGALLETGPTFVTNILDNDTSYFVETGSTCPSPRIEVHVFLSTTPTVTVSDASRCGNGSLVLNANSSAPVFWYDTQYGGISLGSGNSFTTPFLAVSDTFYAEANSGCPSSRSMSIAIVNPVPSLPVTNDIAICSPGTVSLNAIATEQVNWFDAPVGGNQIFTGSAFVTPSLTTTTTYYVSSGYGCQSNRIPVQAIVSTAPSPPTAPDVSRCGPGIVTLSASSPELIYWYNSPTGGTLLATSDVFNTPSIAVTTTYYAEAGTFCRSGRSAVQAIINDVPAPPTAASVSRCGNGSVTLNASALHPVYWYSAQTGGTLLSTGNSFTTPSLSNTTTYYLEDGSNCRSSRIPVQAIISQQPSAPQSNDVSRCGTGTVTLSATSSSPVTWYSSSSGGSAISSGQTFTTPTLSSTTIYYAEANNGCASARTQVQAIINAIPSPPAASNVNHCGPGTVTLNATSPEQIYWYTSASGGSSIATGATYNTPSISTSTTYYVETGNVCRSSRVSVQAVIITVPTPPTLTGGSSCGSGTVLLTASSTAPVTWYNVLSGGSSIGSGSNFTTPVISTTTTYYAQATNAGCGSTRASIQAVIGGPPNAPVAFNNSRCGQGIVTIFVTSQESINWFDVPTGGVAIASGLSFTTPSISTTTTYYAEAFNNCGVTRVPVQAIIESQPVPPVGTDGSRCGTGTVILSATSASSVNWYTSASGGNAIATGLSFTTPVLNSTTTYYAESFNTSCNSSSRIPVQAIINTQPAAPVASSTSRCGPGILTISVTSTGSVNWYSSVSGGSIISTGLSLTTPSLNTSTTYYATASNGCESARVPVQAIINNIPNPPSTINVSRCGNGTVTLNATSSEQVYWYTSSSGITPVATGLSFTTPSLTATTTYYVETGNICRSSRVTVNAIITPVPSAPSVTDGLRCGSGTVDLLASSSAQVKWFIAATGGSPVGSGTNFTTPVISSSTTYYAEATNSGCSSTRIPVQAVVNAIPADPIVTNGTRCGSGQLVLSATGTSQLYWYADSIGGSALDSGSTFTTPVIFISTNYFVEASNGSCTSKRILVEASINGSHAATVNDAAQCGPGSMVLSATAQQTGDSLVWYDHPGGNILANGEFFTTPLLNATTVYYVEVHSVCTGSPIAVTAYIYSLPSLNLGADTMIIQSGQSVTLSAGAGYIAYQWSTGETSSQIQINTQGTYSVSVTDSNGCSGTDQVFLNIVNAVDFVNGKNLLKVFPNPAHDQFTFELSQLTAKSISLKLFSTDGKMIRAEEVKASGGIYTKTISLNGVAAGVYYLKLENNDFSSTIKVIVE